MVTRKRIFKILGLFGSKQIARDSSVGRAEDCSCLCLISLGHRFKSGLRDLFAALLALSEPCHCHA